MLTRTEILHRMRQRQRWLERKYSIEELDAMDLDDRSAEEIQADLGDEEHHRQAEGD